MNFTINCAQCGEPFRPHQSAWSAGVARFCGLACRGASKRFDVDRDFWPRVDKSGDCWLWTGSPNKTTGYGKIKVNGVTILVHAFAYALQYGELPDGHIVRHGCDVKMCVRHLISGTYVDNMRDAIERDRLSYGERRYNAKLSDETVRIARAAFDNDEAQIGDLARRFRVNHKTMAMVVRRESWKHVA